MATPTPGGKYSYLALVLLLTASTAGVMTTCSGAGGGGTDGGGGGGGGGGSAPAAPSGLSAAAQSSSTIRLTWTDNSGNEDSFRLERSSSGAFSSYDVISLGANTTSYNWTGLSASSTHYFRVCAVNDTGSSSYSNSASATTSAAASLCPEKYRCDSPTEDICGSGLYREYLLQKCNESTGSWSTIHDCSTYCCKCEDSTTSNYAKCAWAGEVCVGINYTW